MSLRAIVTIAAILISLSDGYAQLVQPPVVAPEIEPLVKELLAVTGARERVAGAIRAMLSFENFSSPAAIPAEEATFDSSMTDALNRVQARQNARYKQLIEMVLKDAKLDEAAWYVYAPLYGEGWTAEELRAMIAFYSTPLGKKIIQRDPQFHLWEQIRTSEFFGNRLRDARKLVIRQELVKTNPARATADDIRSFGIALEYFAYEHNGMYPAVTDPKEVQKLIEPAYSFIDVWGTPFRISFSPDRRHYRIVSAGSDRKFSDENLAWGAGSRVDDRDGADLVFEDGVFRSYPAGAVSKP